MRRCGLGRASWSRPVAVTVVFVVLVSAAGCGARWSDDQKLALATQERGDAGPRSNSAPASGSGEAVDGEVFEPTEDLAASPDRSDAGGVAPGAPGEDAGGAGPGVTPSSKPCQAPSDAPGVNDRQITLGTINSISGPSPGLGASSLAAARAYVAYRNSVGGVCGRQIVLLDGDDGVDNARNRALVNDFEARTLALVSGNACGSDGSAEVIQAKRYPVIGLACGTKLPGVDTFYSVSPRDIENESTAYYRYLVDQGVRKAAVVYVSAGPATIEGRQKIGLLRASGIQVVLDLPIPLTTLSYDSTARAVANSGADYLVFVHASAPSAAMAKAMVGTGYKLKYSEYRVAYGSNFIDLAGSAAEGSLTWITWVPEEDGGVLPEQRLFLEWMQRTAPNAFLDTFSNNTWAAAKLVLDLLESLPGPISRDAFLAGLDATNRYDAAGLIAPVDIGAKHDSGCMIGMVAEGGRWRRLTPTEGFLC